MENLESTLMAKIKEQVDIDLCNLVFAGGPTPVQEVVKERTKSCGLYADNAIKPIQGLIALGRAQRRPVIYTTSQTRDEVNPAVVYATKHKFRGETEPFDFRADFKTRPATW